MQKLVWQVVPQSVHHVGRQALHLRMLLPVPVQERTCELEAKLRQAIQDTHPLTTTLDWDFHAADRERDALLAIG